MTDVSDLIDKKIERIDRDIDKLRIRNKEADDFKVREEVFDELTLKVLYRLASSGLIQALGGVISTGKEANVVHALGPDKRELAIKVYRIKTSDFKAMQDYILGDHRFAHVKKTKKDVVFAWTKKEFRNLTRASNVGVRVPEPVKYRDSPRHGIYRKKWYCLSTSEASDKQSGEHRTILANDNRVYEKTLQRRSISTR